MKWVDTTYLAAPAEWYINAHERLRRAAQRKGKERKRYIHRASSVWTNIKPYLEALSGTKCWYCEGHYKPGAPNNVDHFRPKSKVVSLADDSTICDEGYWRLAFELENYRLSCYRCNTAELDIGGKRGKASYFPIADETKRASGPRCSPSGIAGEQPLLLDPLANQDCELLYFDEDGGVEAIPNADAWQVRRVALSKRVYALTRDELTDERRRLLEQCRTCVKNIDDALAALNESPAGSAAYARGSGSHARNVKALRDLIRGPHSAAIICYLQARTEHWLAAWLAQELAPAALPAVLKLTHSGCEAHGLLTTPNGSFVVLRGSSALPLPPRARTRRAGARLKANLRAAQVLSKDGKVLRFERNVLFASEREALNCILNDPPKPSAASWS